MQKIGQARAITFVTDGKKHYHWLWKNQFCPRVMFPSGTVLAGDMVDMHTGEVFATV